MIQEIYKKESLSIEIKSYPNFIPSVFKENQFLACVPNMYRWNIKFKGLENKDKLNQNNTKNNAENNTKKFKQKFKENFKVFLVGGYLKLKQSIFKMQTNNKIEFEGSNSQDNYEEIVQKLLEVFIYLKQEAYNETRPI